MRRNSLPGIFTFIFKRFLSQLAQVNGYWEDPLG